MKPPEKPQVLVHVSAWRGKPFWRYHIFDHHGHILKGHLHIENLTRFWGLPGLGRLKMPSGAAASLSLRRWEAGFLWAAMSFSACCLLYGCGCQKWVPEMEPW